MPAQECNIDILLLDEDGFDFLHLTASPKSSLKKHEKLPVCILSYRADTCICWHTRTRAHTHTHTHLYSEFSFSPHTHTHTHTHSYQWDFQLTCSRCPGCGRVQSQRAAEGGSQVCFTLLPCHFSLFFFPAWPVLLWPVMQGPMGPAVK